ncbi:bifunctional hydroxymethylpyrimidine kinase/phosphomethylpyrimidine kinase [soil metagenome]
MQTVLTIAGFDPSSGAGVTADLMVFAAHGLFGTSCITSLTVQSTRGVLSSHPVSSEVLRATLDCLVLDLPPSGIKIGMLATAGNVEAVADFLEIFRAQSPNVPVVLDPVLRSSSGRELLNPAGLDLLRARLLPQVDWVTPNTAELAVLTGLPVETHADLVTAGQTLQRSVRGGESLIVLAKGGHLDPPDDLLIAPGSDPVWLPGEHIVSTSTHGTGCAFASSLLSRLVLGDQPHAAALAAKAYVAEAIRAAIPRGSGNGPLNHLWNLNAERTL